MHELITHLHTFVHMGGYAAFVWSSYGAMLIIFLLSFYFPAKRFRRLTAGLRGKH